jgi:poly(3-hydroxybutyrate) depolymerase
MCLLKFIVGVAITLLWLLSFGNTAFAGDWPPELDKQNPVTHTYDGRTIERYVHGCRTSWGYPVNEYICWEYPAAKESNAQQQNNNSFYIVHPKTPHANTPLFVVLHSGNRTAYDYLGYSHLDRKLDAGDDPPTTITNSPDDFYALYLNCTNYEWWGGNHSFRVSEDGIHSPTPTELRILETIEWVASQYPVDRDRIYLSGVSMGGSGTLGIGMPNGNVFAAIRAIVPCGTRF